MTVRVLQSKSEIQAARRELRRSGLSCVTGSRVAAVVRITNKLGLTRKVPIGDVVKSWDILNTVDFIRKHVPSNAPILDIGAYASEILCVLNRMDYSALAGVDLNPRVKYMPCSNAIRFQVADFMHTPFPDESFQAITAISVIEHGFASSRLLAEVARQLRPQGYFIASFDYWPDKINTDGISIFDMTWRIFSSAEVAAFLAEAETFGLKPTGPVNLKAAVPSMAWSGKQYTFAWMAIQKSPRGA